MHICKPSTQEAGDGRIGYLVNLRPTLISKNCPMFEKEKKKKGFDSVKTSRMESESPAPPKRQTEGDTDVTSAAPHTYAHVCVHLYTCELIHIHKHITQCAKKQKGKKATYGVSGL